MTESISTCLLALPRCIANCSASLTAQVTDQLTIWCSAEAFANFAGAVHVVLSLPMARQPARWPPVIALAGFGANDADIISPLIKLLAKVGCRLITVIGAHRLGLEPGGQAWCVWSLDGPSDVHRWRSCR